MFKPGTYRNARRVLLLLVLTAATAVAQAQPDGAQDPTRPPQALVTAVATVAPAAQLNLDSILVGRDRRVAVINGQVMGEGDSAAGLRVLKIGTDTVVVRSDGVTSRLQLASTPNVRRHRVSQ